MDEERIKYLERQVEVLTDAIKMLEARVRPYPDAINANADSIDELYEKIATLHKCYSKIFGIHEHSFNSWVKDAAEIVNGLRRGMMQMQEAYYHVFPERLAQDNRLLHQLRELTGNPIQPGADTNEA